MLPSQFSLDLTLRRKPKRWIIAPPAYIGFNQKKNRHSANSAEKEHVKTVSTKQGYFLIQLKIKMANLLFAEKFVAYVIVSLSLKQW
jgi:hypothetical protein